MHIFPGQRFAYNPMKGGVEGGYFGCSSNGWIKTEFFYGWIKKHFSVHVGRERPVLLLVDGHTTHIDLDISQFCKEDRILLYSLPPHSSHITQPLDVGFFAPLKTNWKRAVNSFKMAHIGQQMTKEVFARVFKEAWQDTIKPRSIVNAFRGSGIYPVDASKAGIKIAPSKVFCDHSKEATTSKHSAALEALEAQLSAEMIVKFAERLAEGYDLNDPLYVARKGLKTAVAGSENLGSCSLATESGAASNPIPEISSLSISTAFKEVLTVPKPVERKKTRVTAKVPSHLSGNEVIRILEDKKKKEEEEAAKAQRKAEREERKLQREREKEIKAARGRGQRSRGRGSGRGRGSNRGRGRTGGGSSLGRGSERRCNMIGKRTGGRRERERGQSDEKSDPDPSTAANSSRDNSSDKSISESDARGRSSEVGTRQGETGSRGRRGREKLSAKVSQLQSEPSSDSDVICPECKLPESKDDESTQWVMCDNLSCSNWYHVSCTNIDPQDYDTLSSANWLCPDCEM